MGAGPGYVVGQITKKVTVGLRLLNFCITELQRDKINNEFHSYVEDTNIFLNFLE